LKKNEVIMNRMYAVSIMLLLVLTTSVCNAAITLTYGTPASAGNPLPSPIITDGQLINFDDKAAGPVGASDYAAEGVASITELTGATLRYYDRSNQSRPNYLVTGGDGVWKLDVRFEFNWVASQVGIGISNPGQTLPAIVSVLDSSLKTLASFSVPSGLNKYVLLTSQIETVPGSGNWIKTANIKYLEVSGNSIGVDDLQHNATPEPGTFIIWSILGGLGIVLTKWYRKRA
jgi:hypothetical protein